MNIYKKMTKGVAMLLLAAAIMSLLVACSDGSKENEAADPIKWQEYDIEKLDEYIKPFKYEDLDVRVPEGKNEAEAIWDKIVADAEIVSYPEIQVEYYAEQERLKYRYYAERDKVDYDKLLESLGVTEKSIYESAKKLVKEDLVFEYIVKDAKISLSDAEKEQHFDKYAQKFVNTYGYNIEYVTKNMKDQIYEAMLYDKTMEHLIIGNSVSDT